MTREVALSGMRPTGVLHLGNYFGALSQFVELQRSGCDCFFFIADIHSLTKVEGWSDVDAMSVEVAKCYIACGVEPRRSVVYRQVDVPEISEIAVLLGNIVNLGRLTRCPTFKDEVRKSGLEESELSLGRLSYPVLMAADILSVRATKVPVGKDQTAHVEFARDIAGRFNQMFKTNALVVPAMNVTEPKTVPGLDGAEKMGKTEGNTISLLDDTVTVRKKVAAVPTQATAGGEMMSGTKALYQLVRLCCPQEVYNEYTERYRRGDGRFFRELKETLAEAITKLLKPIQERHQALPDGDVRTTLKEGAATVRPIARAVLDDMRSAMGLRK